MQALEDRPLLKRHRFDVEQYHRMAETRVLDPQARVELIEGELIEMAPIGTRHFSLVNSLTRALVEAVGARAIVSVQQPVRLDRFNEPEPDLALLKPRVDRYATALPSGADALLVIEVADSSLAVDLGLKARLYASNGVAHYWVIDVQSGTVHLHSEPQSDGYRETVSRRQPGTLAIPELAGASIDLTGLL